MHQLFQTHEKHPHCIQTARTPRLFKPRCQAKVSVDDILPYVELPAKLPQLPHISACNWMTNVTSSQISSTFSNFFVVLNAMFFFKDHCRQSDFSGRLSTESLLRRSVPQGACQRARWISGGLVALHNLRDAAQKVPTEPSYQITPSPYYDPPK